MTDPTAALSRRQLFGLAAGAGLAAAAPRIVAAGDGENPPAKKKTRRANRIGVSTYSFWQFKNKEFQSIERCIDLAADMGFDGVEVLHVQMPATDNAALQKIKQAAFRRGVDLMGFSTHQTFVSPEKAVRQKNIEHTNMCIELAYALGIPTVRVNTGRWGTSKDFDELMANKGIEPRLEGYSDDDGFEWVIDSLAECLPTAEKCGVVLGLENHWGLGREASGVLRVVDAIDSPWLQATLDTGNFLENKYEQMQQLAPRAVLVQAKTYFGGGTWYTLDLDYEKIAGILAAVDYEGYISLEFEGNAPSAEGVPKSLELLRGVFDGTAEPVKI